MVLSYRSALLNLDCFWYNTYSPIFQECHALPVVSCSEEEKNGSLFSLSHFFRIAMRRTCDSFFMLINCFVRDP